MKSLRRIGLFILTNILIMVTISIVINLLGIRPYLSAQGIDYGQLAAFCLVWGMSGSLISLAMSRMMAKWLMGVQVIEPAQAGELAWLVQMVHDNAKKAGMSVMPQVGVYDSPDVNAFATGPTKNRALVAYSSGILRSMGRNELDGVTGHEIAHIVNGDMVTMTLLQGILNAFVLFLSKVIAYAASQAVKEDARRWVHFVVDMVVYILLSILAGLVVCWFSRKREFRADAGSAKIAGREKMIAALQSLQRMHGEPLANEPASMAAFKIRGGAKGGFMALFSTHPPLEERIARLQTYQ